MSRMSQKPVFSRFVSSKRTVLMAVLLCCLLILGAGMASSQETTPEATAPSGTPPPPLPAATYDVDGISVDLFFEQLPQGRVGVIRVQGDNITGGQVIFLDRAADLFLIEDEFYGLLVIDMDQSPRLYDFSLVISRQDGGRVNIPLQVDVTQGGFIRQPDLNVPPDRVHLIDPEIERLEFARLSAVFTNSAEEKLWDDAGFQLPIESEFTSPFGSFRTFNQTVQARHTGWDLRAPTGTPVRAMASGRVAFAGLLDIRGNHIVIDHGLGLFSGYSHLSQIHVTRGQTITAGQIIGVSGNTGRSGGAHLHWEININGDWVDSADFMRTWIPG